MTFSERNARYDVEMKVLDATTVEGATHEARRLRFGGRTAHVFDSDRYWPPSRRPKDRPRRATEPTREGPLLT